MVFDKKSGNGHMSRGAQRLLADFERTFRLSLAIGSSSWSPRYNYMAVALAVRDRIAERWVETIERYNTENTREVYYLSLEFLIGRLLSNNAINLGIDGECEEALQYSKFSWSETNEYEVDAGLGNGGLGRLAACFMDSMATLDLPAMGYGLRYDYGIFRQLIVDGSQVEEPDNWLRNGYPWEMIRPEREVYVNFGGDVRVFEQDGKTVWRWIPSERVRGVPFDIPIVGYGAKTVNTLRLWSASADNEFNLAEFNRGSYVDAVQNKVKAENLTKVLYPNDNMDEGKELRLRQQYFFVACTVRDVLRRHMERGNSLAQLKEKAYFQLNDTHPTLVIAELMRVLVDEEGLGWDEAWDLTSSCVGYTNHTVLPEALEKWRLPLFSRLLPRHTQIIMEINGRFLKQVGYMAPGDHELLRRMSIIEEGGEKQIRMAHLALVGATRVNGVAEIHSSILKDQIFHDFSRMWPEKFTNVTNGITQRRWLLNANPRLSGLITSRIGNGWITSLDKLKGLEPLTEDGEFLEEFRRIKQANKTDLANYIHQTLGIQVDPESIFDVQIKRLHEYKRQFLLVLYIIMLYHRIIDNPDAPMHPRTFIFSGKAAPGYATAKSIIRLIHAVAEAVNTNPLVSDKLQVVFLPDYRVSLAEKIIPAANVSEQISLAGTEASGTGCMKLMLNGALTLGTMDGANVEIRQEVGEDNIFIFGMTAQEVAARRADYSPWDIYNSDLEIRRVIDSLKDDEFSLLEPGAFKPLVRTLLDYGDYYMQLADLRSYSDAQERIAVEYADTALWNRKALLNVARSGKFSSDRTIQEYCQKIWGI